jgi:hypothetical protein
MNSGDIFKIFYDQQLDQRVFTLLEIDGYLLVNMDTICDRSYHIMGVDELLYEIGRRGGGRTVVFLFQDGSNLEYSGARAVINHTIKKFALPPDKCVIFYPGPVEFPGATVLCNDTSQSWQLMTRQCLNDLPLSEPVFDRHFCAIYARFNLYRLKIVKHLHTHYANQSMIAFNTAKPYYGSRFTEEFEEDAQWATEHLPIRLLENNVESISHSDGFLGYKEALHGVRDIYQKYFIEIVSETDPHSDVFFSEKTLKNFWLGKPFLLFSGPGSLKTLRSRGYVTFSPYIDEYYDEEYNDVDRLGMILSEINRLASMSIPELQKLHVQLQEVFEYNRSLVRLQTRDWAHTFVDSGENS